MDSRQPCDLSPEEQSYLHSVVSDENAVQFFCERADGLDWLRWVSDQSEFRALFDPVRLGSAISWRLAAWFAKNYITDELSGDALAAVRSFGGRLSPQLWDALARRLLSLQETGGFTVGIRPWLLLLTRTAPDQSVIFLDMLLSHCGLPAEMEPAALLFSYLTQPQVVDAPSVFGGLRSEVRLRGDRHRLHDMWNDVFKPSLEFAATVLLPIIDHHLRSAQRDINLSYEFGSGEILGSPVHPVATSSGESYSDPSEFLVEAARDCVEALLRHDVSRAESQLTAWASSDVALLRRLAIHGWTVRSDVDASTMANWLGNQGLILDYDYQAETAPFIARILESNDTEAIDDVIADILAHANDDRFTPRRALRTLNWMRRAGLAIDEIDNAIASLIDQHNDLEPLVQAAESVSSEPPPLTAADELKLLLDENDIQGAVSLLQQYATQDERADVFTWDRIENTLAGAVRESPALGFSLLDRVDHSSDVGMAVVGPVIRGWSTAVVADELAQRILSRIASLDISRSAGDVAAMLAGVREAASQGTEWTKFATSRDLAKACWAAIGTEPAEEKDDWFHTALNSPAGQLAIYWLHVADDEHSRAAGGWQGLPPDLSTELAAMLTCGDGRGELVEVVFGRDVSFLHSIDPNWCEEHVVRLFDWADEPRALRVWSGYLSGGRFNDDLLRAGLLDVALQAVIRAQLFRKQLRHSLFGMLAQTAIRSMLDPREWVPTLVRNAGIEDRVLWADEVTDYLGRIEPDEVEVQWGRWMRSYWEGRLESVPRRMNTQEASSMAQWVVYLSESVGEGVGLVVQCPAAFTQYSRLLHELSEQRVQNDPSAFAQLVSHLLCGTELPFYGYEVSDVLRHLRSHGIAEQQLNTIKEQALRLGITLDDR